MKASALTYYTLLSIIPIFALIFGIAHGFGFRETLQQELESYFVEQDQILDWINNFILGYLDNARGGAIAGIGLIMLIWSVIKVLGHIERSFNHIWDIKNSRPWSRKFSDYISFMVVAALFVIVYSGFTVFISNTINGFDLLTIVGPVIGYLSPVIMVWAVFTVMFIIMPNTKVTIPAAIFGGILSGTGFIILQLSYIYFQMGVSKYNAIYGSFAAIPLFLIWLQSSWLIVLFGAELAAAFQNVKSYEFEIDTKNMSFFYRRLVSLMTLKHIIDKFKNGDEPPTMHDLLLNLKLPVRLASEVIYGLKKAGLIQETTVDDEKKDNFYIPAFDINQITVEYVINKLENSGTSNFLFEENDNLKELRKILKSFDQKQREMPENVLLKDL